MFNIIINLTLLVLIIISSYLIHYYRKIAFYDDLTGTLRRGKFESELVRRMRFVKSNPNYILHLYLIDLDNFKSINDTKGHTWGDHILWSVANTAKRYTRKLSFKTLTTLGRRSYSHYFCHFDLVGRLGGDEFAVCCVMKKSACLDLREKLGKRLISSVSDCSISVGMSIFKSNMDIHVKDLKDSADKNLYHSKRNGKGTITMVV